MQQERATSSRHGRGREAADHAEQPRLVFWDRSHTLHLYLCGFELKHTIYRVTSFHKGKARVLERGAPACGSVFTNFSVCGTRAGLETYNLLPEVKERNQAWRNKAAGVTVLCNAPPAVPLLDQWACCVKVREESQVLMNWTGVKWCLLCNIQYRKKKKRRWNCANLNKYNNVMQQYSNCFKYCHCQLFYLFLFFFYCWHTV